MYAIKTEKLTKKYKEKHCDFAVLFSIFFIHLSSE